MNAVLMRLINRPKGLCRNEDVGPSEGRAAIDDQEASE